MLGVEPYFCPSLSAALKAGKPVHADTTATLADGLAVPTVRFEVDEANQARSSSCWLVL